MADETYLQKSAQYQSGDYVVKENLHKEIFAFLVVGLKQSTPFVVQSIPAITLTIS